MAVHAVKALITIVSRGKGESVSAFFNKKFPQVSFLTMGDGTAGSEIMTVLGLDTSAKDVVFSFVNAETLPAMMAEISGKKFMKSAGLGIAFSLRLTGIGNLVQAALLQGSEPAAMEGDDKMAHQDDYSLILAVAEPGYTDQIMEIAKDAGARGGTVLYARGIGHGEAANFLGISIQAEREIIAILTPAEQRIPIMEAINSGFGLRTEAKAILLSLPVEDMVQVS